MWRFAILIFLSSSFCCAQGAGDFQPSSTNVWGAEYPRVDSAGRVQIRVKAPDATKVRLNFWSGPKVDMEKQQDGYWTVTTPPLVPGFHYYSLIIDGMEATVDPSKVIAVVHTNEPDGGRAFAAPDESSRRIAEHVSGFFQQEIRSGRIPSEFLPLQSGVGNICNAVLSGLASCQEIPRFKVYTEVLQDAMLDLIASGKSLGASATALTLSDQKLKFLYQNFAEFADRIVLRPQEISNNPGIARQLGVIATNTAIEVDLYGHVNSTHIMGTQIVNGLGGSGDFERNAYLSVFMCPSTAKGGRISTIVPMCSHIDHSEHSVQVVVTEQGLADLRGLAPLTRGRRIIENCAHPAYRDALHRYLENAPMGHIGHDLRRCFDMHLSYLEHGAMLPELDLTIFEPHQVSGQSNGR